MTEVEDIIKKCKLIFESGTLEQKKMALQELANINHPDVIELIKRATRDRNAGIRYFARKTLNKLSEQPPKSRIYRKDVEKLLTAIEVFGIHDESVDVAEAKFLEALLKLDSNSPNERLKGIEELITLRDTRALKPLHDLYKNEPDEKLRAIIVTAISKITPPENPEAHPCVVEALNDKDPRVKANAVEALKEKDIQENSELLLDILMNSSDNRLVANTAITLNKFYPGEVKEAIKRMLSSDKEWMIDSALYVVGELNLPEFLDYVIKYLKDGSENLKNRAKVTYEKLQVEEISNDLMPMLLNSYLDPSSEFYDIAKKAINKIESDVEKARTLQDASVERYIRLITVAEELKEFEFCKRALRKLITIFPEELLPFNILANICVKNGQIDEACKIYKKIVKISQNKVPPLEKLAELYVYTGKFEEAMKCYIYINKLSPSNFRASYRLGELYFINKYYDQALAEFTKVASSDNKLKDFANKFLGTIYLKKELVELALKHFNKVKMDDPDFQITQKCEVYYEIAFTLMEYECFKEAKIFFEKVEKLDPCFKDIQKQISKIDNILLKRKEAKYVKKDKTSIEIEDIDSSLETVVDTSAELKTYCMKDSDKKAEIAKEFFERFKKYLSRRYSEPELIGKGGMGLVVKALDNKLMRTVAIKVLLPYLAQNEEFVERFIREARAVATLNHPYIIKIFDIVEDKFLYIVMEYVKGELFRDILKKQGKIPVIMFKKFAAQLCQAFEYAHKKGVIHRDIKPDNIMLAESGNIKIMDFGLAKLEDMPQLTKMGAIMGTNHYMSPEQITGKEVDFRTDIYSLGVTFYEFLTGYRPFEEGDIAYKHVNEPPSPPSSKNELLNKEIDDVILKALSKNKEERFNSDLEFLDALLQALPV